MLVDNQASPALSSSEMMGPSVASERSEEGLDIVELFGDIDWCNANLGELEQQWRAELMAIEEENVKALIDSTSKSQQVVPALRKAIEEVEVVDALLTDYCQRLQIMGTEIQQIEELNRGLNIQTTNQKLLLEELEAIINRLNFPEEAANILEREALDVPRNIQSISKSAKVVHELLLSKFEDGLGNMVAVTERLGYYSGALRRFIERERLMEAKRRRGTLLKLTGLDDLIPFLEGYAILISSLREMDLRKHGEVVTAYQNEISIIYRKELTELIETIKSNRLVKKTAEEKTHLFVSLNASTMSEKISIGAMGERIINIVLDRSAITSERDFVAIEAFDTGNFPELEPNENLLPDQTFHYIILSIALVMATQQDICATIFYGIREEEEPEERLLKLVDSMLIASFSSTDELLTGLMENITKADNSSSIDLLVVLDIRIPQLISELPVFAKTLQTLKRRLLIVAEQFIADQVAVIEASKYSARKRSGIFPFVALFPNFIERMEKIVGAVAPGGASRDTMNRGYERITGAIFRSLDALAQGAERSADEKERINASVMNIQNGHYLVSQLNAIKSLAVETSLGLAKSRYDQHLKIYASLSLHRVFGRLMDFFFGMSSMLENTPPEEVAFHASYNKASAKRILQAFSIREIRKHLETVFMRVEKHFVDDKALQQVVWRVVQDEFLKNSIEFSNSIQKVYPGTDVQLAYSVADAMACFSEAARF